MTSKELRELRNELKIDLLELAATIGLPEDYLAKIESGTIPALDSDLKRIEKGLRKIAQDSSRLDDTDSKS